MRHLSGGGAALTASGNGEADKECLQLAGPKRTGWLALPMSASERAKADIRLARHLRFSR